MSLSITRWQKYQFSKIVICSEGRIYHANATAEEYEGLNHSSSIYFCLASRETKVANPRPKITKPGVVTVMGMESG